MVSNLVVSLSNPFYFCGGWDGLFVANRFVFLSEGGGPMDSKIESTSPVSLWKHNGPRVDVVLVHVWQQREPEAEVFHLRKTCLVFRIRRNITLIDLFKAGFCQWWIQDFPWRGCANLLFGKFFFRKLHDNERNWTVSEWFCRTKSKWQMHSQLMYTDSSHVDR